MTTQTQEKEQGFDLAHFFRRGPIYFTVLAICIIWSIPTFGVLVSSFRDSKSINSSGWWMVFAPERDAPDYVDLVSAANSAQTRYEARQGQLQDSEDALLDYQEQPGLIEGVPALRSQVETSVSSADAAINNALAGMAGMDNDASDAVAAVNEEMMTLKEALGMNAVSLDCCVFQPDMDAAIEIAEMELVQAQENSLSTEDQANVLLGLENAIDALSESSTDQEQIGRELSNTIELYTDRVDSIVSAQRSFVNLQEDLATREESLEAVNEQIDDLRAEVETAEQNLAEARADYADLASEVVNTASAEDVDPQAVQAAYDALDARASEINSNEVAELDEAEAELEAAVIERNRLRNLSEANVTDNLNIAFDRYTSLESTVDTVIERSEAVVSVVQDNATAARTELEPAITFMTDTERAEVYPEISQALILADENLADITQLRENDETIAEAFATLETLQQRSVAIDTAYNAILEAETVEDVETAIDELNAADEAIQLEVESSEDIQVYRLNAMTALSSYVEDNLIESMDEATDSIRDVLTANIERAYVPQQPDGTPATGTLVAVENAAEPVETAFNKLVAAQGDLASSYEDGLESVTDTLETVDESQVEIALYQVENREDIRAALESAGVSDFETWDAALDTYNAAAATLAEAEANLEALEADLEALESVQANLESTIEILSGTGATEQLNAANAAKADVDAQIATLEAETETADNAVDVAEDELAAAQVTLATEINNLLLAEQETLAGNEALAESLAAAQASEQLNVVTQELEPLRPLPEVEEGAEAPDQEPGSLELLYGLADAEQSVTESERFLLVGEKSLRKAELERENYEGVREITFGSDEWQEQWTMDNYNNVLNQQNMETAFFNSLLVTVPAVVIPITIAAFAAYAFAWMTFPGKNFFFAVVVILMVVPLHTALIPILKIYLDLDLNGTYLGIWLAHTGFGMPLAIYLLYGYIATIPRDILESAKVDGASPYTTFTRLIIPLSVPAIASFAIFQFLWVWNDLLVALVFLGTEDENTVLTRVLSELVGSRGQDWELLTAGAFISMIVPLFVFFSLQRYFVRGLMAGSVKG